MEVQEAMQLLEDMKKLHDEKHNSVVLVLKDSRDGISWGSGFIVKSTETSALVMTCYHIIEAGKNVRIRLAGTVKELKATIKFFNKEADIALLKVGKMSDKISELTFREESKDIPIGKPVFLAAYFNPTSTLLTGLCLDSAVHPGKISAPLDKCPSNPNLMDVVHSCRSQGGCSGGALIYDGEVIGVHYESRTQMEYARSSETINILLKKWLKIPASQVRTIEQMIASIQI